MKKVILLALVFMFALSAISMARDRGHGKGNVIPRGKWWRLPQVVDKLALTQEEKGKLDTIYLEHRHRMIDLRSQMARERLELQQLASIFDLRITSFRADQ